MKKQLSHILILLFILFLSSCQNDLSKNWGGTYTGIAGSSTVQRVVVTIVDKKTVKMELQTNIAGSYYAFATISKGKLTDATTVIIDEDGTIVTVPANTNTYRFSGTGKLNGNTLTLNGVATNKANSSDVLYYTFTGTK